MVPGYVLSLVLAASAATLAAAAEPLNHDSLPASALGWPDRDPNLDVLPSFKQPPPGYGEVAFYWWVGDPLTKERLQWQLDQLSDHGVMGLQINYAHSDRGGLTYGLTMPSEPPLFSEAWWELTGWFMQQAKARGMSVSLSDYTLGIGQGWSFDAMLKQHPELTGSVLHHSTRDIRAAEQVRWELPINLVSLVAFRLENNRVAPGSGTNLAGNIRTGVLEWRSPDSPHRIVCIHAVPVVPSIDPMHPNSGNAYAEAFFGQFERRFPGENGRGLNFFFSDELEFRVRGNLWNDRFAAEFQKRKGYDLRPELAALFMDTGPRTPKVRLDYSDVKVALTEEGFFRPVFEWHQKRRMVYGCDHGGRGRDVAEFGDYFRTQRWNQGPGCDQPGLARDVIKNKVASSIAHLYLRPRVWLEGYHSSGWGTTTADLVDATLANFAQGQNLLTLHGLYYTTHGGWWEWAPPCNHFRMPYWPHMKAFADGVQRLSYLLSQGFHRCDIAILYPVAPVEAGLDGSKSVSAAFSLGEHFYARGLDFDFIDFESLARTEIVDRQLHVSGERYRVLILPSMPAVRWSTIERAAEFHRAGGLVVSLGALPQASDRTGRDDPHLHELVAEVFDTRSNVVQTPQEAAELIARSISRDVIVDSGYGRSPNIMHREIGFRDVYMLYGAAKGTLADFRATGKVELWNPWTGETKPISVLRRSGERTKLRLPLTEKEAQIIVFSPGQAELDPATANPELVKTVPLEGDWEFELKPTLDNQFGDFHWPPSPQRIGAEARQFFYSEETSPNPGWEKPDLDHSRWPTVTASFGPQFWKLGPLRTNVDAGIMDSQLLSRAQINPDSPLHFEGRDYLWQPYLFSWRWGIQNDPGHQGYHGLKEAVHDDFIGLGKLRQTATGTSYDPEALGSTYYLYSTVVAPTNCQAVPVIGGLRPGAVWANGQRLPSPGAPCQLKAGPNPLLLRYEKPGRGSFILQVGGTNAAEGDSELFSPAVRWIWHATDPEAVATRFFHREFALQDLPLKAILRITCDNSYSVFINGQRLGAGNQWQVVAQYDALKPLVSGTNVLGVEARNEGGQAGLIAELLLVSDRGLTRIPTDRTWSSAERPEKDWQQTGLASTAWKPAQEISAFENSLWARHPLGPPKLDERELRAIPENRAQQQGSLEMSWYRHPGLLRFDTRPMEVRPAGWYRFLAPPGLRALNMAAHGTVRIWAHGQPVDVTPGRIREDGSREYRGIVRQPRAGVSTVAIRIEQQRGYYGGATVPEAIALDCAPGRTQPGDWAKMGVLECYSGGAWYRKNVGISPSPPGSRTELDLGSLASSAEVWLNGKSAGTLLAPPWKLDITSLVRPGQNRIEILVYNTLANHYLTIPTRYRGSTVSGLLGPVALRFHHSPDSN